MRAALLASVGDRELVRFSVTDTGDGIAQEDLARLFQAFEQADASISRRHGGTGLGLSITLRLARLMGGSAGATSSPGQGSEFWFTAWLQRSQQPALRPVDATQAMALLRAEHAGAKVLVVDDNEVNRQVATAMPARPSWR